MPPYRNSGSDNNMRTRIMRRLRDRGWRSYEIADVYGITANRVRAIIGVPLTKTLRERFEEKFIPEPMSGCWLWLAGVDKKGRVCKVGTRTRLWYASAPIIGKSARVHLYAPLSNRVLVCNRAQPRALHFIVRVRGSRLWVGLRRRGIRQYQGWDKQCSGCHVIGASHA